MNSLLKLLFERLSELNLSLLSNSFCEYKPVENNSNNSFMRGAFLESNCIKGFPNSSFPGIYPIGCLELYLPSNSPCLIPALTF
ncbi:MAG: hypothetical protein P8M03_06860 [Flavobacteriaceae bacterium]|nr:hypothetical protein [Flavobacteriaceae bacterium]